MVWGDISYDGSTDLYVIRNGSLTCIIYRDEIIAPIVRLYAGAIVDDFILMDDNARPHRARIGNEYLQRETIEHGLASKVSGPKSDRTCLGHLATSDFKSTKTNQTPYKS
jgi:hypothetical protein